MLFLISVESQPVIWVGITRVASDRGHRHDESSTVPTGVVLAPLPARRCQPLSTRYPVAVAMPGVSGANQFDRQHAAGRHQAAVTHVVAG